jgi:hypothetical protein
MMNEIKGHNEDGGVSVRTLEIVVAGTIMALAALVMYDNWRIGAGWASDGPEAGYFPFYVGLLLFVSGSIIFIRAIAATSGPALPFVEPRQFRQVLALLAPSIAYVAVTAFLGIYVTSALYLAFFMAVLGRYRLPIILPVALGVPLALFLLFEVWFLVPLPKGPLELWLGY